MLRSLVGSEMCIRDRGMAALGAYMHSKGASFGLYTAESPSTCGGYPASANHEMEDAKTFAGWGVDYMKVDGCGPAGYYKGGYRAMGEALEASGRDIVYSCSWPAYINNGNESLQPFGEFVNDGCNLWRNYKDIQCNWASLGDIIDHWGDYGEALVPAAGPGHWHDMDMLLIGAHCISTAEEQTQMAIWAISASPLIMGNDLRNVSATSRAILLNKDAIAVSQDPLGQMGRRISNTSADPHQLWARNLADGQVAVALYNKQGTQPVFPPFVPTSNCQGWNHQQGGYYEACGGPAGNLDSFTGLTLEQATAECCANPRCAGFSFSEGAGYYKENANCGIHKSAGYDGYTRPNAIPSAIPSAPADITVEFADLNLFGEVEVFDIWDQKIVGTMEGSYTARAVPFHGSAFLRLKGTKL
eukprot:TRINITY_DN7075_c0_g1_i8.p1 TRINITY_DN7075_c0_g1~~TRINITY_DN7075_c0_g1_i8.p1  ORF type:complete len:452 (+),score=149.24 TRINITY_DN7075_c0_g1_i8:113-1357(+)